MEKEPEIHSNAPLTSELLRFRKETNDRFMFPLEKERERLEQEGKIETPEMRVLHGQFYFTILGKERNRMPRTIHLIAPGI